MKTTQRGQLHSYTRLPSIVGAGHVNTTYHGRQPRGMAVSGDRIPPTRYTEPVSNGHFTEYKQVGHRLVARNTFSPNREHCQSLPNTNSHLLNRVNERSQRRQVNSAPNKAAQQNHAAQGRPVKVNNLVQPPPNNYRQYPYDHAGIPTKDSVTKVLKSDKFATSQIEARAKRGPNMSSDSRGASSINTSIEERTSSNIASPQVKVRKEKKVAQGKPKIATKVVRPNKKVNSTYMEIEKGSSQGSATGGKTTKASNLDETAELDEKEQEKLQKSVYGSSHVKRVYAAKTTLTKKDLSRDKSAKKPYPNPYVANKIRHTPPWRRKEYVLSKFETKQYKNIHKVYESDKHKKTRQEHFFNKLEKVQTDEIERYNESVKEDMVKRIQSKIRQQMQLIAVREKFDEEQAWRFRTQYVTIRNLKHEYKDRHVYGLPDELNDEVQHRAKIRRKKPLKPYEPPEENELRVRNKTKYNNLFEDKPKPKWDSRSQPPKMEGIDTIEIDNVEDTETLDGKSTKLSKASKGLNTTGNSKKVSKSSSPSGKHKPKKKAGVKDVLADAKKVLQEKDDNNVDLSPRRTKSDKNSANLENNSLTSKSKGDLQKIDDDLDSLDIDDDEDDDDDDDDDIFEKARRKYNINLDSDED